jgi:hypothetical protein
MPNAREPGRRLVRGRVDAYLQAELTATSPGSLSPPPSSPVRGCHDPSQRGEARAEIVGIPRPRRVRRGVFARGRATPGFPQSSRVGIEVAQGVFGLSLEGTELIQDIIQCLQMDGEGAHPGTTDAGSAARDSAPVARCSSATFRGHSRMSAAAVAHPSQPRANASATSAAGRPSGPRVPASGQTSRSLGAPDG